MSNAGGRFITFEGGEGTGKSTQARLLCKWLREEGIATVLTREPGGSPRAELLRELLLNGSVAPFGPEAEAVMFAVARADHIRETIRPALRRGEWVISDRFLDSTWAYQGTAGVSEHRLAELDAIAVGQHRPDLTLILDLAAESGMERVRSRHSSSDRFEAEPAEVQNARRHAFLRIAEREPERCVVVDAASDQASVAEAVRRIVASRLPLRSAASA